MSFSNKIKKFFFPTEEFEVKDKTSVPATFSTVEMAIQKNVSATTTTIPTNVISPIYYQDVKGIADILLKDKRVDVSIEFVKSPADVTRIVDFLAGVTYAANGDIYRLDDSTFRFKVE